ncbi:nucleoside recognition domain protein [Thermosinus carboxydivorans Nor1]|uniref:Nucleoside recognition domain protein n=1 Tax=Thermosinus carboxydivorans Nor1 TaxID=401526 RepID=A1HTN1_9FIRM|nr:nucleoside recognition domain-containing protein [Thermosinus carboxydivorans]EAX46581.1 nucleoside recognition domain protein [Thermosinus carboxydivorans Nor1]
MINFVWMFLIVAGIICAAVNGRIEIVTKSAISAAEDAVALAFKLIGVMCLWLGVLKIAEQAGIVRFFARLLSPVIRVLFSSVPRNHPAMGAIVMTVSANMLGLGNAVTPFGIKAMQELQKLNPNKETASPAMCTLLALCTTGFTLVPATIIALRSAAGSVNPAEIVGATLMVSLLATCVAVAADRVCRMFFAAKGGR